ncbi:MAG: hypothetical protein NTZ95_06615, partial [Candidatus Omnitrophica bacterium]|nr:hypothetical protein [Candidatus Omnitrophota bacterium]
TKIAVHPDFRLFATLNPIQGSTRISLGRSQLPGPFINRFKLVWVKEKTPKEEFAIFKDMLEKEGINTIGSIENIASISPPAPQKNVADIIRATAYSRLTTQITKTTPLPVSPPVQLFKSNSPSVRSLFVTGEQPLGIKSFSDERLPKKEPEDVIDGAVAPEKEMPDRALEELAKRISTDPETYQKLADKKKIVESFFRRFARSLVRITAGKAWEYFPKEEVMTYPLSEILETGEEKLAGEGMHEGMHRYGTRYVNFMPFIDKATNILFNAAEDVTIDRWGTHLVGGGQKLIDAKDAVIDTEEWGKSHFGKDVPEYIKFLSGIFYRGKRGSLPAILQGDTRTLLEDKETSRALEEVFETIPKVQDEKGNIYINKEPTPMEITAAAKRRVEVMRDKILPIYQKLIEKRREELERQYGEEQTENEIERELAPYAEELEDKTKDNSADWQKALKEVTDKKSETRRAFEQRMAAEFTAVRSEREMEGRRLSDEERFLRIKALEDRFKRMLSEYQLNLDVVRRLVHALTGQLANIIREDIRPRWLTGLRKGKDID